MPAVPLPQFRRRPAAAVPPRAGRPKVGLRTASGHDRPDPPGSGIGHHGAMSVVKINALTVPEAMRAELERRFAARAGEVSSVEGFEYFELLRPVDGTDRYLVYTRWRSEEDFRRWQESQAFQRGHAQHAASGPAATAAELWSFEVVESEGPKPSGS